MFRVKRLEPEEEEKAPKQNTKATKRKAVDTSSTSSSSSSSSSSDSDSPAPVPRNSAAPVPSKPAATPNKKKAAASSSSSSSSSSSFSSSSSSSSSDSDSDAPSRKKSKVSSSVPPTAPAAFKPVSDTMFQDYGFVLPSGAPPTAESLAREAADRQAKLDAAAAARRAAEEAARAPAAPPKLKQLSAKQAASLTKVAKLNAAQAAKLDAAELEAYRKARAEEKKAIKLARRELNTPEERAAAKAEARRLRKEQAKQAKKQKEEATTAATAEPTTLVAAAEPVKAPKPPKPAAAPLPPSQSAATNPALRSEGLRKKDEAVRQAERAERKRARRLAMGLPPEEEAGEEQQGEGKKESAEPNSTDAPMDVELTAEQSLVAASHKRKLDDMRNARMAAVLEREEKNPLKQAMKGSRMEEKEKEKRKEEEAKKAAERPAITVTATTAAPASAPSASEVTDALKAKPSWMVRGKQIQTGRSPAPLEGFRLDERIVGVLRKQMGITALFPTQAELLPIILKSYGRNDICVCAPTGSGKTLAYALPIMEALKDRVVTRLRALILVPSRDLALQVYRVLFPFCAALQLRVEVVIGQSSFDTEKRKLGRRDPESGEWRSEVDILISTPGRLMDHLSSAVEDRDSYGFHLRDLQYFVIDEIDRLLTQNYQDWPGKILQHIYDNSSSTVERESGKMEIDSGNHENEDESAASIASYPSSNATTAEDQLYIQYHHLRRKHIRGGGAGSGVGEALSRFLPLQKLLFSATLTNNPQKLAQLQLSNPLFFTESTSERKKFQIPINLKQWIVNLKDDQQKPLVLIYLLQHLKQNHRATMKRSADFDEKSDSGAEKKAPQILIFTSSIESTHRLYRLLELYDEGRAFPNVAEFSSALQQKERNRILRRFGRGECEIIICSDSMSRGIDLNNISVVINYDVPQYIQTYVHRVGRTARAGAEGVAYTMVKASQFRNFKSLLYQADNSFYSQFPPVNDTQTQTLMKPYQHGLAALKNALALEKQGEQDMHQPIEPSLRSRLTSAAAASLASAAEVDDAVDEDLEDKNTKKKTAEDADGDATMEDEPAANEQRITFTKRENVSHIDRPKAKKVKL